MMMDLVLKSLLIFIVYYLNEYGRPIEAQRLYSTYVAIEETEFRIFVANMSCEEKDIRSINIMYKKSFKLNEKNLIDQTESTLKQYILDKDKSAVVYFLLTDNGHHDRSYFEILLSFIKSSYHNENVKFSRKQYYTKLSSNKALLSLMTYYWKIKPKSYWQKPDLYPPLFILLSDRNFKMAIQSQDKSFSKNFPKPQDYNIHNNVYKFRTLESDDNSILYLKQKILNKTNPCIPRGRIISRSFKDEVTQSDCRTILGELSVDETSQNIKSYTTWSNCYDHIISELEPHIRNIRSEFPIMNITKLYISSSESKFWMIEALSDPLNYKEWENLLSKHCASHSLPMQRLTYALVNLDCINKLVIFAMLKVLGLFDQSPEIISKDEFYYVEGFIYYILSTKIDEISVCTTKEDPRSDDNHYAKILLIVVCTLGAAAILFILYKSCRKMRKTASYQIKRENQHFAQRSLYADDDDDDDDINNCETLQLDNDVRSKSKSDNNADNSDAENVAKDVIYRESK